MKKRKKMLFLNNTKTTKNNNNNIKRNKRKGYNKMKKQAQATSNNNNNIFAQALATLASTQKQARKRDSIIASNASNGFATLTKQACKQNKQGFVYVLHNATLLQNDVLQALGIASASTRNRLDKNKAQVLLSLDKQAQQALKIALATDLQE